jgi:hypothetical protein
MNPFEPLIERILNYFAGPEFKTELTNAKAEFFDGPLDEENSESFDLRMSQFYDWYFFTREISGYGQTPLEVCHMIRELRFSVEDMSLIESLKKHRHSLFQFIKIKGQDIYLKDLLKDQKIVVKQSELVYGFNTEEIFDVRLIPYLDSYVFTKGFSFHPSDAQKFILNEVKSHRKDPDLDPEVMMLRLIKMRFRFERYRHVKPEMIYSNESKI